MVNINQHPCYWLKLHTDIACSLTLTMHEGSTCFSFSSIASPLPHDSNFHAIFKKLFKLCPRPPTFPPTDQEHRVRSLSSVARHPSRPGHPVTVTVGVHCAMIELQVTLQAPSV
eukprot:756604-Hanusia_phi.AAC.5